MNSFDILNTQIANEIMGKTVVTVNFNDTVIPIDRISLFDTVDGFFIEPAWCKPKKISEEKYRFLMDLVCDESISTSMNYDEFMDRYYN